MTSNSIVFTILFSVTILGCAENPSAKIGNTSVKKIIQKDLEIFFGHNLQPVMINEFNIPVMNLRSGYSDFSFSLYLWSDKWKLSDSVRYMSPSQMGLEVNGRNLIESKSDLSGKVGFEYDSKDRLVKRQYYDNMNVKGGYFDFLYSSDGREMFEVVTNKNTLGRHDTLRKFTFDSVGKIIKVLDFGKGYTITKMVYYNNKGLIDSIEKRTNFFARNEVTNEKATYSYLYNSRGDWIDLTIEVLVNESFTNRYRCARILKE